MFDKFKKNLIILVLSFVVSGCASPLKNDDYRYKKELDYFSPVDISPELIKMNYKEKYSYLILLIDNSPSMSQSYRGRPKKEYLQIIYDRLTQTLPKTLRIEKTKLWFGGEGEKTLSETLLKSNQLLANSGRGSTILILSEWNKINSDSRSAVEQLLLTYDDNLCINMIGVGNLHANKGLLNWKSCGVTIDADSISTPIRMADFVRKVFFSEPADVDDDGIYDYMDRCKDTKTGVVINWFGCDKNSGKSHPYYLIQGLLRELIFVRPIGIWG